jgi:apolipoprotein N-acyltransferase
MDSELLLEVKRFFLQIKINQFLLIFLLGSALSLGVAPFHLWYISLPALGVSLQVITKSSDKKIFYLKSLLLFSSYYGISSYWVINTFQVVVNNQLAAYVLGVLALLLIAFAMAFCMASLLLLGWVIKIKLGLSKIFGFFLIAVFFTLGELTRSEFLGGYPMHLLGYMVGSSDELIQLASVGSVFLVSFILVFTSQLLFSGGTYTLSAFLLFSCVFLFGWVKINIINIDENTKNINVRIVNANFTQKQLIDQNNSYQTVDRYIQLSQGASKIIPDLIVWPESVLQFYIKGTYMSNDHARHIYSFLKEGQTLITGGPSIENSVEIDSIKYFSSLFTLDNNNTIHRYDKHRLVPWGEYIPLRDYIPESLANLFDVKDYTHGEGKLSVKLDNELNILPLLCAEGHFPQMLWQYKDNQNLIVMIGNEAWLAGSIEPDQYFVNAKFRAVESGLPVLLVSNKGYLAVFNKHGEVQAYTYNIKEPTVLDASIKEALYE